MKRYRYDHLNAPGGPLKELLDRVEALSRDIDGEGSLAGSMAEAHLVIGHFEDDDIEDIRRCRRQFERFPAAQVVVLVTTQPGFPQVERFRHSIVNRGSCQRAMLFVRDMKALADEETLRHTVSLTFGQAAEVAAGRDRIFKKEAHPFAIPPRSPDPHWLRRSRAFCHDWLPYFLMDVKAYIKTGCRDKSLLERRFADWEREKRAEAGALVGQLKEGAAVQAWQAADAAFHKCAGGLGAETGWEDFLALQEAFSRLAALLRHVEG